MAVAVTGDHGAGSERAVLELSNRGLISESLLRRDNYSPDYSVASGRQVDAISADAQWRAAPTMHGLVEVPLESAPAG